MRDGPLSAGWLRLLGGGVLLAVAVVFLVLVLPSTFEAIATDGHGPLPRTRRANGPAWWIAVAVFLCAALATAPGIALGVSGAKRILARRDLERRSQDP